MERKKFGQIQGRISRRLVYNPTIQHVITNLYTKYDFLACTVVEKSLTKTCYGITEGRTEGQTEWRTDVNQYTPSFFKRGYNNLKQENRWNRTMRPSREIAPKFGLPPIELN